MKLVEQYGHIYKMSDTAYKRLLRLIVKGQDWDIEVLGGKDLGPIAAKPLSLTPMDGRDLLKELQREKERAVYG
jgi:hypothetical protein